MQIEMLQALAALRSTGVEVPPEAMWLLERELPSGVLRGTVVCANQHDVPAGNKFCPECGIIHGRAGSHRVRPSRRSLWWTWAGCTRRRCGSGAVTRDCRTRAPRTPSSAAWRGSVKPSVGRIVHYVSYGTPGGEYGKECRAAIVTEVYGDPAVSAGLCVLNPAGQFFNRSVLHDEGPGEDSGTSLCGGQAYDGGTWHWPARVD